MALTSYHTFTPYFYSCFYFWSVDQATILEKIPTWDLRSSLSLKHFLSFLHIVYRFIRKSSYSYYEFFPFTCIYFACHFWFSCAAMELERKKYPWDWDWGWVLDWLGF
ncbi:hypothetical protein EYC84_005767 [Monilinia fructicola]|uniref:Uncharacterized protein n=1 Tax=Monilinia fructicola TaxID=38448 RepID=A0A5M9K043_MONFR|nr:hypothetical protein EYC84_005767 [Monilinia fructicola]